MNTQTHEDREREQRLIASAHRFDERLLAELDDDDQLDWSDFPLAAQSHVRELMLVLIRRPSQCMTLASPVRAPRWHRAAAAGPPGRAAARLAVAQGSVAGAKEPARSHRKMISIDLFGYGGMVFPRTSADFRQMDEVEPFENVF